MANIFKATLDDLPEILSGINYQLQRIADALEGEQPQYTPKITPGYIRGILQKIVNEENKNGF
jgi:hypothetical protein